MSMWYRNLCCMLCVMAVALLSAGCHLLPEPGYESEPPPSAYAVPPAYQSQPVLVHPGGVPNVPPPYPSVAVAPGVNQQAIPTPPGPLPPLSLPPGALVNQGSPLASSQIVAGGFEGATGPPPAPRQSNVSSGPSALDTGLSLADIALGYVLPGTGGLATLLAGFFGYRRMRRRSRQADAFCRAAPLLQSLQAGKPVTPQDVAAALDTRDKSLISV